MGDCIEKRVKHWLDQTSLLDKTQCTFSLSRLSVYFFMWRETVWKVFMEVDCPTQQAHLFILCRELVEGIQHHLCISLGLRISLLKDLVEKENSKSNIKPITPLAEPQAMHSSRALASACGPASRVPMEGRWSFQRSWRRCSASSVQHGEVPARTISLDNCPSTRFWWNVIIKTHSSIQSFTVWSLFVLGRKDGQGATKEFKDLR